MRKIISEAERGGYKNQGKVWCPILGDYVSFNNMGLRHLIGKRGVLRSKKERERRFALLPQAARILGNPNARPVHQRKETIHRARHQEVTKFRTSIADFWIFRENIDSKYITVVVRQFEIGKKHFLSIY